jgi:hypothetical protein
VLLYRALTGHYPFDGTSLGEVILKIGTKDAVPMRMLRPELPPALDSVVLRALSRDRGKRFQDLEDLARSLMQFTTPRSSSESGETGLPPGAVQFRSFGMSAGTQGGSGPRPMIAAAPTPAIERRARKRRTLVLSAGAALALLIAGALLLRRDATPETASAAGVEHDGQPSALHEPSTTAPTLGAVAADVPPALPAVVEPAALPVTHIVDGKDEPEEEPSPPLAEPPQAQAPVPSTSDVRDDKSAVEKRVDKHSTERSRPTRPASKAGKASAGNNGALIPGERTNGFSVDEF